MTKKPRTKHAPNDHRLLRVYGVISISLLLALIVFIPQRGSLEQALRSFRGANLQLMALGALFVLLTFFASAAAYVALALKPVRYQRMVIIQLANGFASKLLPAGSGGIAVTVRFLCRQKHSVIEAGSVVTLNNLLGFVGHIAILCAAIALASPNLTTLKLPSFAIPVTLGIFALVGVVFITVPIFKSKLLTIVIGIIRTMALYRKRPQKILIGLAAASTVTILNASVLFCVAKAFGIDLSILQTLVVFSSGVIGGTLTPTPGGIGGAEAVLTAALITTGTTAPLALSVALGYRLLTYWLPIMPGLFFFHLATRRRYI